MRQAAVFFSAVLAYIWFLLRPLPWTVSLLAAAVAISWRKRSLTATALGLTWSAFPQSLRSWRILWLAAAALCIAVGNRKLLHAPLLLRGCLYFVWCAVQQAVYQSMIWIPLRSALRSRAVAACLSGAAFAAVHAPNPVLVPATFVWGSVSSLLFERCRSVWGLALLQVLLSSTLLWLTPAGLNHGFRVGPSYYEWQSRSFFPARTRGAKIGAEHDPGRTHRIDPPHPRGNRPENGGNRAENGPPGRAGSGFGRAPSSPGPDR